MSHTRDEMLEYLNIPPFLRPPLHRRASFVFTEQTSTSFNELVKFLEMNNENFRNLLCLPQNAIIRHHNMWRERCRYDNNKQ